MEEFSVLMKLIQTRQSCRVYQPDRTIPDDVLRNCIEAARSAPSACNRQPWHFVLIREKQVIQEIAETALLPGLSMPWVKNASCITVLCSKTELVTHILAPLFSKVRYQLLDCGIAGEQFVLAAQAQGIASCWIGWFKPDRMRKIIHLPKSYGIVSLIALGYSAETRDNTSRKTLSEIASDGTFGTPFVQGQTN